MILIGLLPWPQANLEIDTLRAPEEKLMRCENVKKMQDREHRAERNQRERYTISTSKNEMQTNTAPPRSRGLKRGALAGLARDKCK